MKRDLDLIRRMLLRIEEKADVPPNTLEVKDFLDMNSNPHYISLHIQLLLDAGFIEVMSGASFYEDVKDFDITRLTFAGYEYLDTVRNSYIWERTKERLANVGGAAALGVVKAVAEGFVKIQLGIG